MQVLIIAVQNSVDYEHLGVATSGTMLFRSLGGALGVALCGAIFANRLHPQLAGPGMDFLATILPAAAKGLPPELHEEYITAVMLALRPVFLVAAGISAVGFVLAWMLREYPLREGTPAEGMGESFAMPRDATSLEELERIITLLLARENRWRLYADLAVRAGVELPAPELWMLARLGERAPTIVFAQRRARHSATRARSAVARALCARHRRGEGRWRIATHGGGRGHARSRRGGAAHGACRHARALAAGAASRRARLDRGHGAGAHQRPARAQGGVARMA
jgi:hypothetical protein